MYRLVSIPPDLDPIFKDSVSVCPVTDLRRVVRDCTQDRGLASVRKHRDFHPPTLLIGFPLEVDGGSPTGAGSEVGSVGGVGYGPDRGLGVA